MRDSTRDRERETETETERQKETERQRAALGDVDEGRDSKRERESESGRGQEMLTGLQRAWNALATKDKERNGRLGGGYCTQRPKVLDSSGMLGCSEQLSLARSFVRSSLLAIVLHMVSVAF